jgi:putative membrane protein
MKTDGPSGTETEDGAILTLIKGFLIGIANIIPGVSGGTFALILGVFDRIIGALNSLGYQTLKVLFRFISSGFRGRGREAFIEEWRRLDLSFLTLLSFGAVAAIFSSSFLIDYLLKAHYSPTLAFFIGLIIPSVAIPWAMMTRRGAALLLIAPGIALTVGVSLVMPDSAAGNDNPLIAILTGAAAISAMILPGISGSYVMLVMGQYQNVLARLTGLQIGLTRGEVDLEAVVWLAALALGMVVGIILFARLLHFLLRRFRSGTMAFLIGLLIGSLWVLWPFKEISEGAEIADRHGEIKEEVKIATAPNRMPKTAREGLIAGGALVVGLAASGGLIIAGRRRKREE